MRERKKKGEREREKESKGERDVCVRACECVYTFASVYIWVCA